MKNISKNNLIIFILVFIVISLGTIPAENITTGEENEEANITLPEEVSENETNEIINITNTNESLPEIPEEATEIETNITIPDENITAEDVLEINETGQEKVKKKDLEIEEHLNVSGNMPIMETKTFGKDIGFS